MAVLELLCGPQGTHKNNGGILGGVMALMGTPGAQDVCFMAPWYRQNKFVGKSQYRFILKPWQLDFSHIESSKGKYSHWGVFLAVLGLQWGLQSP